MVELGSVQNIAYSENIKETILQNNMNLKKVPVEEKTVDDAVVVEIHNPINESPNDHQDDKGKIQNVLSLGKSMRGSIIEFREQLAKLKQQAEEIANSRFTAGNLAKNFRDQIEEVLKYGGGPKYPVYSDVSEKLARIREEIKAILSYDGFLLGVHDNIEEITEQMEFTLEQVFEVVENISDRHESLELDKFSLIRVREEAIKTLRCQANISGERALKLLENPA